MKTIGSIRRYRNTVHISFNERGENFDINVPHKNKWLSIIRLLKKRGFNIGENEHFKEHYGCLSKFHKKGFKNDVACLMEISAGAIKIEFGNIQNLWKEISQSFWDNPNDDRFTKLTYLEGIAVELEIKKVIDFCSKYNLEHSIDDSKLSPEDKIIYKLKNNTHIHGEVKCLNDIKLSITEDSYDYKSNSNDANKKKIICGDLKYFYDCRTKRLSCGIAWHNINNMWWIISAGNLRNIASFKLFDFSPELTRREELSKEEKVQRLHTELKREEKNQNYLRCIVLKDLLNPEKLYNIWSIKHDSWWRPNNNGYTTQKNEAGVYTEKAVHDSESYYNDGISSRAILISK